MLNHNACIEYMRRTGVSIDSLSRHYFHDRNHRSITEQFSIFPAATMHDFTSGFVHILLLVPIVYLVTPYHLVRPGLFPSSPAAIILLDLNCPDTVKRGLQIKISINEIISTNTILAVSPRIQADQQRLPTFNFFQAEDDKSICQYNKQRIASRE